MPTLKFAVPDQSFRNSGTPRPHLALATVTQLIPPYASSKTHAAYVASTLVT